MRALLALSFAQAFASGPAPESVHVVAVEVDGRINDVAREKLQEAVTAGLERGDVAAVAEAGDAKYAVTAKVTRDGRDYLFELVLADSSGKVIADVSDRCEICGVDEVADLIAGKAAVLGGQIAQLNLGEPVLSITSTPVAATVSIDGNEVGKTPFEGELPAGKHVVRLTKDGHITVEREMDLSPGVRSTATFTLEEVITDAGPRLPSDRAWTLGWVGVGTGAAILGGGIALLAIDDRVYSPKCTGANVDADGDCKFLLNTMWSGAVAATIGGALITAGAAFLLTSRRGRKRMADDTQASVVPGVSPGGVSLSGRF